MLSQLYLWRSLTKPLIPIFERDLSGKDKDDVYIETIKLLKPAIDLCKVFLFYLNRKLMNIVMIL